jgi:hypothetical protein
VSPVYCDERGRQSALSYARQRAGYGRAEIQVLAPERVQVVCELLARSESESAGCKRAGIGLTAWSAAKGVRSGLRERIASARD